MSTTARAIIKDAYIIDGILQVGAEPGAAQAMQGLDCLNEILGQWSLMPLTIPATLREVFPLAADRGGPSDPYTIGPLGDFNTSRPPSIKNVGLLVTNTSEPFEIQRVLYTDDAYASIVQKELTSTYFTGLYYNKTFADGLATINLWPVPSATGTSLVLYRPQQLAEFATLDTEYVLPPGALPALKYELAKWLMLRFKGDWTQQLEKICSDSLSIFQRGNASMTDLGMDVALTAQAGVYNILSDAIQGQGR